MPWIPLIEEWIVHLATQVPLPAYVFAGEMIEEIISPIPSQAVLITAGSIAQSQAFPLFGLLFLALIATIAKTATTLLYYILADKMEDRFIPRFGKYIGITHTQVEAIGKRLDRGGTKEMLALFVIRCLPIFPSSPVSAICGLFKISIKSFLIATLAGNFIRGGLMLLTGYLGFDVLGTFLKGNVNWTTLLTIVILGGVVGFFVWAYSTRYKERLN
ncbi:VTT domain-containing protein [Patescibacteria group bacterium]|nr:VTT domain-containing protein [Patescibacteria group bacterium]